SATSLQVDGAASFNGTSNDIDLAAVGGDVSTSEGTMEVWVNIDPRSATPSTIMTFRNNGSNEIDISWSDGVGNIYIRGQYAAGGTQDFVNTSLVTDDNTTHFLAQTWSKAADQFKFYVDGVQAGTTQTTLGTFSGTPTVFDKIGNDSFNNYYKGKMDEIRVSNTPRSAGWITTGHNNQKSPLTFYSIGGQETYRPTNPGIRFR
ncbi:MAG: LamG domain-containing protein, partial [Patescibacteria group bacterium]